MSHARMTAAERRLLRCKTTETKAQRLERVARQMREHNRLNLERARRRREEWAKVRDSGKICWCQRCGNSWITVIPTRTKKCKRCQSPVWDQPVGRRIDARAVDLPVAQSEGVERCQGIPDSPTGHRRRK